MARPITGTLVVTASEIQIRVRIKGEDGKLKDHFIKTGLRDEGLIRQLQPSLVKRYLDGLGRPTSPGSKRYELPAMTMGTLVDEYFIQREASRVVSWKDEKRWWTSFCKRHLQDYEPKNVRTVDVERVLIEALKQGTSKKVEGKWTKKDLSLESLKKVRSVLVRIFDHAERSDLVVKNPAAKARIPSVVDDNREREQLVDEEFMTYATWPSTLAWSKAENAQRKAKGQPQFVDGEIQMMAILARTCGGMRTGDLHALVWERLDWKGWHLKVYRPKTSKKGVPQIDRYEVPEPVRPFITTWWQATGRPEKGPFFPARGRRAGVSQDVSKAERKAKQGGSYAHRFRRDLLLCGIDRHELHHTTEETLPVDFHSWRRNVATAAKLAGISDEEAKKLTGHSSDEAWFRYLNRHRLNERPIVTPEAALPFSARPVIKPGLISDERSDKTVVAPESRTLSTVPDLSTLLGDDTTLLKTDEGDFRIPTSSLSFLWSGWQDLNLQQPAPKGLPAGNFRGIVLDGYSARYPKMPDVARRFTAIEVTAKPSGVNAPEHVETGTPADDVRAQLQDAVKRGDWVVVGVLAEQLRAHEAKATSSPGEDDGPGAYRI